MSFFKNIGKQKSRFSFFIEVHTISLPRNGGISTEDNLVISFEKGDKKSTQTGDHPVTLQATGLLCTVEETLSLDVTLYKEATGLYAEKIGKVNIYQRRRGVSGLKASKESLKSIGICSLPLHGLADGKSYDKKFPLTWTSLEGAMVHLTILARPADEGNDNDDADSVASSQISKRSGVSAAEPAPRSSISKSVATGIRPNVSFASSDDGMNHMHDAPAAGATLSAANLQTQKNTRPTTTPADLQEHRLNTLLAPDNHPISSSIQPSAVAGSDNNREVEALRKQVKELNIALRQAEEVASQNPNADALMKANMMINDLKKENSRLQADRSKLSTLSPSSNSFRNQKLRSNDINPGNEMDIDFVRAERDQLASQMAKLSSQLSERKVAFDDARAEVIRTKVQMAALVQAMEQLKSSSRSSIMSLAQHATTLEVKLAEMCLENITTSAPTSAGAPRPASTPAPVPSATTMATPTRTQPQQQTPTTSSSTATSWAPSTVSFGTPSKGGVANPFATTSFDASNFDSPSKSANGKKK